MTGPEVYLLKQTRDALAARGELTLEDQYAAMYGCVLRAKAQLDQVLPKTERVDVAETAGPDLHHDVRQSIRHMDTLAEWLLNLWHESRRERESRELRASVIE